MALSKLDAICSKLRLNQNSAPSPAPSPTPQSSPDHQEDAADNSRQHAFNEDRSLSDYPNISLSVPIISSAQDADIAENTNNNPLTDQSNVSTPPLPADEYTPIPTSRPVASAKSSSRRKRYKPLCIPSAVEHSGGRFYGEGTDDSYDDELENHMEAEQDEDDDYHCEGPLYMAMGDEEVQGSSLGTAVSHENSQDATDCSSSHATTSTVADNGPEAFAAALHSIRAASQDRLTNGATLNGAGGRGPVTAEQFAAGLASMMNGWPGAGGVKRDADGLMKGGGPNAARAAMAAAGLSAALQQAAQQAAGGGGGADAAKSATLAMLANNYMMAAAAGGPAGAAAADSWVAAQAAAAAAAAAASFAGNGPLPSQPVTPSKKHGKGSSPNESFSPDDKRKSGGSLDYTKYIRKYSTASECVAAHCLSVNLKEHYHCLDCSFKIFVKKEEMTRHYKWHKKREESLQHGFMRYSPFDDCSIKFGACAHNNKQTHYHCIQGGCNKVYISTSDVQMHATYHRKAFAIEMEGFQRFRATEGCGTPSCAFYSLRTTHFHCMRQGCAFTFKNKAEMEKHKTYHQKDAALSKDGFKKFMKYEHCPFEGCCYSNISNHTHCIRPGCGYVLPSSSQLHSHKKKHEKQEFEQAFKRFKDSQTVPINSPASATMLKMETPPTMIEGYMDGKPVLASGLMSASHPVPAGLHPSIIARAIPASGGSFPLTLSATGSEGFPAAPSPASSSGGGASGSAQSLGPNLASAANSNQLDSSLNLTFPAAASLQSGVTGSLVRVTVEGPAGESSGGLVTSAAVAQRMGNLGNLSARMSSPKGAVINGLKAPGPSGSANSGNPRDELWKKFLTRYTANDPCQPRCDYLFKDHYHCNMINCKAAFRSKESVREHARNHDNQERMTELLFNTSAEDQECPIPDCSLGLKLHYHCKFSDCSRVVSCDDEVFSRLQHHRDHEQGRRLPNQSGNRRVPRRRGRPPKYFKEESPVVPRPAHPLEDPGMAGVEYNNQLMCVMYEVNIACPDDLCEFRMRRHYHCTQPNCYHAADRMDVVTLHSKDFHSYINIIPGFQFFDRSVDCRRPHCHNNKTTKHFHCVRPRCDYTFVRHTTMFQHDRKHTGEPSGSASSTPRAASTPKDRPLRHVPLPQPPPPASAEDDVLDEIMNEVQRPSEGHVGVAGGEGQGMKVSEVVVKVEEGEEGTPTVSSSAATIKSSGTFFPQKTFGMEASLSSGVGTPETVDLMSLVQQNVDTAPIQLSTRGPMDPDQQPPFCYNLVHICGRPFCKLKKRDHYHCRRCDNAFSEHAALNKHIPKCAKAHQQLQQQQPMIKSASEGVRAAVNNFLSGVNPTLQQPKTPVVDGPTAAEASPSATTSAPPPPPTAGYISFGSLDDCGAQRCTYRLLGSHYHCAREECGRAMGVEGGLIEEHKRRHEQLDELLGTTFKLYKIRDHCGRADCESALKVTHFHCLMCPFICTDASKIMPHKKAHNM